MLNPRGSPEERLAILETRMEDLVELIESGPRVPWAKSIRGRLHELENLQAAADNLAAAAREMRRSNTVIPHAIWKTIAATAGTIAAIVAITIGIIQLWP